MFRTLVCLALAIAAQAADAQSPPAILMGSIEITNPQDLVPAGFAWPAVDLHGKLCGPSDTIESADCKIVKPVLPGGIGAIARPESVLPLGPEPGVAGRGVAVGWAELSGTTEFGVVTPCGSWTVTWSLDWNLSQPFFPLVLESSARATSGQFLGGFEALVRFDFRRESDGFVVSLVRSVEIQRGGTWELRPVDEVAPGASNLRLTFATGEPAVWGLGECRGKAVPEFLE